MKRSEKIKVDLSEKDFREIRLKQMDSTYMSFEILNQGTSVNLQNKTANIIFTKPNGTVVTQSANINEQENIIEVDLHPDCVRDYGKGLIEVELKENEEIISTFQLECRIEKTGKGLTPSSNQENYYEKVEKILDELQQKLNNGDFNGLTAYEEAVNLGFEGTIEEWFETLKGDKGDTGKGIADWKKTKTEGLVDTYTITFTDGTTEKIVVTNGKDFDESKLDNKLENYEKKHTYHSMIVKEEKEVETDVEIPCSYIVGADNIEIFYHGNLLKREKSPEDIANYREVGEKGSTSNKVQFGWKLLIGDELTFIVKGAVEDE